MAGIVYGAALLLGAVCAGEAQTSNGSPGDLPSRSAARPFFWVDTSSFLSEEGRAGVRVTVSVPYNQLHFVRVPSGGYEAIIDVSEIFYAGNRQVTGDVWRHRINVRRYRETSEQRTRFTDVQEFVLEPGEYKLFVRVKNFDTHTASEVERAVVVEPVERGLTLTGLEIGSCPDSLGRVVDADESDFVASLERRFGEPLPPVCARAEVFDPGVTEDGASMRLTLEVVTGSDVVERVGYIFVTYRPRTAFLVDVPVLDLIPGMYELVLTVEHDGRSVSADRDFEIDASRIDMSRNYDDLVRLATLFLQEDVDAEIGDVPEAQRREAWNAFWKERDPDPDTERNELLDEFFRRIRVTASRFGVRGRAGWATDRGKVYIRFGEPDDIEYVPRGFNSPAYEIWRYADEAMTFTFADTTGFGDYVLVQPSSPPF